MKLMLGFLSWLMVAAAIFGAEAPKICVVCQQQISKTIYFKTSRYLEGKQAICEACIHLQQECFTCELPVRNKATDLGDGRYLCERDARAAILSDEAAHFVFNDVKRDLMAMFSGLGRMPDKKIDVHLVNQRQMESLHRVQRFPHDKYATVGLTRTRSDAPDKFHHEISVLTGMNPARFEAVAAHEYTHTWLQENVPGERPLDGDTVEGFCEYVAYRLMQQKHEPAEMALIVTNDYTRGQVHAFLQVEPSRFYEVAKWMKTGVDQKLGIDAATRVLATKKDEPAVIPGWALGAKPAAAATSLTLRGVSGTAKKRYAMINDQTFAPNDLGKVRLGASNVVIRCLEVSDEAAVIQLVSTGEKRRLVLQER